MTTPPQHNTGTLRTATHRDHHNPTSTTSAHLLQNIPAAPPKPPPKSNQPNPNEIDQTPQRPTNKNTPAKKNEPAPETVKTTPAKHRNGDDAGDLRMKQNRPQTTSKHEKERKQTEDPARSRTTTIGAEKKMSSLNSNRWCGGIATSSSHHHHP
ncbi:hypothetical protein QL285_006445 [Trifolium repens]|nr:hypothetical protein QL285_006445 [Trifolium repens]